MALAGQTLDRACQLFRAGWSVRRLEEHFGIPRNTLHRQIVGAVGLGCDRACNGVINIVDEYLESPDLSPRQREQIQRWASNNLAVLTEADIDNHDRSLLTEKRIATLTQGECRLAGDARDLADNYNNWRWRGGEDA